MKKGQIVEGYVEKVEFPNKGVVRIEETNEQGEKTITRAMVKGVLPGQTIRLSIKKARKSKCQGILREVIKPSEKETAVPACPHFGICGGCNYQTLPYEEQLELKKQQVLDLIRPVCDGVSDFLYDGILPSPSHWEYRNKMEFSFGDEIKDGPLTLGLHKKGSFHDIIHASGCRIVHEDFSKILDCVRDYCAENGLKHYKKNSHEGLLRHLLVRRAQSTGEMLVALVTSSQYDKQVFEKQLEELCEGLRMLSLEGCLTGFLHIVNDSLADVVQSDATRIIYGKDWFMEEILGLQFRITPFSFFQTNTRGAEVLYRRAREYVLGTGQEKGLYEERAAEAEQDVLNEKRNQAGKIASEEGQKVAEKEGKLDLHDKVVFDLYSGTGTIAQMIAPVAGKVIGVEIVEEAVEAARENAAFNGLTNCEFIAGDVLKVIDEIEEKPDYIILDPPRDGIHPKALRKIIDYGVPGIVYISCKPTSLARDLEVFQENGYRVERMSNVDLFGQTVHVETVCLLSKLHSNQHIEVELEMDELDLTAAESKATYEEIKDYVLKQSGLKVSNLYIAQVKQKCGIIERVNYNLPKSENSRQPKCPPEKEKAIKEALEHFQMI